MRFLPVIGLLLACALTAAAQPPPAPAQAPAPGAKVPSEQRREMLVDLARTLADAEKTLDYSPKSISVLREAGSAALFLGNFSKAVEYFRRMIEVDPQTDAPNWQLGIAYFFNKQYAESSAQFAKYHAHDATDRENGIWKFLADAKLGGLEKARAGMLPYKEFDREPFPSLYDLYAGKITPEQFSADLEKRGQTGNPRVMFFALYYGGLFEGLLGHRDEAIKKVDEAVALFSPDQSSATGPGYMWQVARVHLDWLKASGAGEQKPAAEKPEARGQ